MTVECITCQQCALRDAGQMARHGFAPCRLGARHTFHPVLAARECARHTPAPADIVDKRRAWLGKAPGRDESTQ